MAHKRSAKAWLHVTIEKGYIQEVEVSSLGNVKKELICHIINYPNIKEGEFLSLSLMNFGEVIDKSKEWNAKSPYIETNELFMINDLTDNDLAVRQINASKILDRLLQATLEQNDSINNELPFNFETDFYGRKNYWFRIAFPLKLITFLYVLLYIPYRLSIAILSIFSPLSKLNTVL